MGEVSWPAIFKKEHLTLLSTLKELNNWSTLMDFANTEEVSDPALLMDAAWHKSNWPLVRQCMIQVDACGNPVMHFKTS